MWSRASKNLSEKGSLVHCTPYNSDLYPPAFFTLHRLSSKTCLIRKQPFTCSNTSILACWVASSSAFSLAALSASLGGIHHTKWHRCLRIWEQRSKLDPLASGEFCWRGRSGAVKSGLLLCNKKGIKGTVNGSG